ncbi:MAG: type II toxin-antitoxin system prevent-host-death family antitoxin [Desulfobacterales bacterium]
MTAVNMHEAKTNLSVLVKKALAGEDIIISKAGKPLVKLVPVDVDDRVRIPGRFKGQIKIAPDFDDTPVEIIAGFEGEC